MSIRTVLLAATAMLAFAANSLFCRLALADNHIDAASFTCIRLVSGTLVLMLLCNPVSKPGKLQGNWISGMALFSYAILFSLAYTGLSAATGALLLFGAVQATMIGYGMYSGERINIIKSAGAIFAVSGLVYLVLPGLTSPPLKQSAMMLVAGISWGIYSLRGRSVSSPRDATAGNFLRSLPLVLPVGLIAFKDAQWDAIGIIYALGSGTLASGLGYAVWYAVLPSLPAMSAAMLQLTVPILAAIGGVLFIGEAFSARLLFSALAILGGVGIFTFNKAGKSGAVPK
jgi:drug/metabolite transporter (DMT)-like permease